jgi:hypothetical protein
MRRVVDRHRLLQFMRDLGRDARSESNVYDFLVPAHGAETCAGLLDRDP